MMEEIRVIPNVVLHEVRPDLFLLTWHSEPHGHVQEPEDDPWWDHGPASDDDDSKCLDSEEIEATSLDGKVRSP